MSNQEESGYGKPPKSSQFKKGQSSNPNGRPRKKKKRAKLQLHPATQPTREIIRAEALRNISIREGNSHTDVPTTQAVVRAAAFSALKGGPMAQRTYLMMALAEDERYRNERKEQFDYWTEYKDRAHQKIASASQQGEPAPDPVPHPEDIELNYSKLEVKFTGPIDQDDYQRVQKTVIAQDLSYELAHYKGEYEEMAKHNPPISLGTFFLIYFRLHYSLPKRLRKYAADYEEHLLDQLSGPRSVWETNLEERCKAVGFIFTRTLKGQGTSFTCSIEELGFEYTENGLQPKTAALLRERSALIADMQ